MIQILSREDLVQMDREALVAHIQEVCFEKKEQAGRLAASKSKLGVEAAKRYSDRLDETRKKYGRIAVSGMSDRDIVLAFIEIRCAESFLKDEIQFLGNAKKRSEKLDKYHSLCESMLRKKDESTRKRR